METYIVKIYRRREPGEEPVLAGILEDAGSGRTARFADPGGLLALLRMDEKKRGAARKRRPGAVKCTE
jgi:hypothetical protein